MTVEFSSNLTKRTYLWSSFKNECSLRNGVIQYDNDISSYYIIWFYNGNEIFICNIWKDPIPEDISIRLSYSQQQNDLDKEDFETNYIPIINRSLTKTATNGVIAQAPAKGLGGFAPDPTNNPYEPEPDELVSHYVDALGQLMVRGPVLTDEGSFRDDFTGTCLECDLTGTLTFTNGSKLVTGSGTLFTEELDRDDYVKIKSDGIDKWSRVMRVPTDTSFYLREPYEGTTGPGDAHSARWITSLIGSTPGSTTVADSEVTLSSGITNESGIGIYRPGDYPPMVGVWRASISQRVEDQTIFFGFRDNLLNPTMYCDLIFEGTVSTTLKFRSAWDGDEQLTNVIVPSGLDTSQILKYKIDVSPDYCALLINGVLVARHDNHVPDMYVELGLAAGVQNNATQSVSTDLKFDGLFWSNQDQVQVSSIFQAPIPVITREDQHTVAGKLTTSSTASDQVILSYAVPSGKVCLIIGYRVDSDGPVGGQIKVGKNDISSEPLSPGVTDGNIFRAFAISSNGSFAEEYGSNPRRLGVGGDTIYITITPTSSLSSTWRAFLDIVLR